MQPTPTPALGPEAVALLGMDVSLAPAWDSEERVCPALAMETFLLTRRRGRYAQTVRRALGAIDGVHVFGGVPCLPVQFGRGVVREGYLRCEDLRPVEIVVSVRSPSLGLALLHEIGHALDLAAFGVPGEWSSLYDSRFEEWWQAVQFSLAYRELELLVPQGYEEGWMRKDYARYIGTPVELFARSYAQWVALRSGDAGLLAELEAARQHWYDAPYVPEQWADQDFEPIAVALDDLFSSDALLTRPPEALLRERNTLTLDFAGLLAA